VTSGPSRRRGRDDRGVATGRGRPGSRRPFRLLSPARAGGLLGLLVAGLLLRLATTSDIFALQRVDAPRLRWTTAEAVDAAVGIPLGSNVFAIEARPIEDRLRGLPAVATASVRVGLPGSLEVQVVERDPILAWRVADTAFLVDRDGALFASVAAKDLAAVAVPVVTDTRVASPLTLAVGNHLDPLDLDVATRLASLGPADIGSAGKSLSVRVDDDDGFVVTAGSEPWQAVFGIYLANVRPATLIPGQVQLLRSLLAGREATLDRIVLADATNGTYTLRATPHP